MKDINDRINATTNFEQNVVVVASAGTGKTTLLIDRIIYLLIGKEVPVQTLVVLTFTEKAAAEMKVRLIEKLKQVYRCLADKTCPETPSCDACRKMINDIKTRYNTNDNKLITMIDTVFNDIDKAQIGTIHSFTAHLLRLYPLDSGVDPAFKVDENIYFDEIFGQEWNIWLENELSLDSPNKQFWMKILQMVDLPDITELTKQLSDFIIPLDNITVTADNIENIIKSLHSGLEPFVERSTTKNVILEEQVIILNNILLNLLDTGLSCLAKIPESELAVLNKDTNKSSKWHENEVKSIKQIKEFILGIMASNDSIITGLLKILAPFISGFRKKYLEQGYVSFNGLLVLTRDLLRNNIYIREKLKKTYSSILIDEFQDTDPIQSEILLYLSEKSGTNTKNWRKTVLTPGKLFIVGDPKQSIYYFRGADITAFHTVQELIKAQNGIEYNLITNFRSHPKIIDAVNAIFEPLIKKTGTIQPEYIKLIPRPGDIPTLPINAVELIQITGENGDKINAEDAREIESKYICGWIQDNVDKTMITGKDGKTRKLGYKDISIILRTLTPISTYLEPLKQNDIPFVVEGEKKFFETQEVIDFTNLLTIIENPDNLVALTGVLRSPLVGLTDKQIYSLKIQNKLDYMAAENTGIEFLDKFYELLNRLHSKTGRIPINELLDEILYKTFIMELSAISYYKEQTIANIMKFRKIADKTADTGVNTLHELVAIMREYVNNGIEEGENPLADDTYDAIRLFSIHKSKGLEYPVIFLPNLHADTSQNRQDGTEIIYDWTTSNIGISIAGGTLKNINTLILKQDRDRREKEEEKRIFYVGCTRAKERLILLGGNKYQPDSFIKMANSVLSGQKIEVKPVTNADIEQKNITQKKQIKIKYDTPDWDMLLNVWKQRIENESKILQIPVFQSPSSIKKETDTETPGYNMVIGIITHRILELWDYEPCNLAETINKTTANELKYYPHINRESVLNEITGLLTDFVKNAREYREIKSGKILAREIPFSVNKDNTILRGVIDLIYKTGSGEIIIVDYKTDKACPASRKEKKYEIQKEIYTYAVEEVLKIKPVTVKLVFLRDNNA